MKGTLTIQLMDLWARVCVNCRLVRQTIQFKASLMVIAISLLVVSMVTGLAMRTIGSVLLEYELESARDWTSALASSISTEMSTGDSRNLNRTIHSLLKSPSVAYAVVSDPQGEVIASVEAEPGLLQSIFPRNSYRWICDNMGSPVILQEKVRGLTCIEVVMPVYLSNDAVGEPYSRKIVGYLRLATNVTQARAELAGAGNQLLRIAIGVVLLVVPCSLVITRQIVHPLRDLAQTAREITRGATRVRARVRSKDEIGQLAQAFNVMTDRLVQSQMEMLQLNAQLEARVEQRTRQLEELAARDPLTGLYNRRHFDDVIAREYAAAQRYNEDLTCVMMDLDNFKVTNDRFGHRVGDEILIMLGEAINGQLRSSDIAARYGGDEFILLLVKTSSSAAATLTERIVSQFNEAIKGRFMEMPVTVSIGAASLSRTHAETYENLIQHADFALYHAKHSGRNLIMEATASSPNSFINMVPDQRKTTMA